MGLILLWGVPFDSPMSAVHAALMRRSARFCFLDQCETKDAKLSLFVDEKIRGFIRLREHTWRLEDIEAAYLRPYDSRRVAESCGASPQEACQMRSLDEGLLTWSEVTPALVVNRPSAMAANGAKPLQAAEILRHGFLIPRTMVTTDPDAVVSFWETHGAIVYKSVSGTRSIVRLFTPAHRVRLPDVVHCPTQFQQYVPGTDYRVHVVGQRAFSCAVCSDADDYRYATHDGLDVAMVAASPPGEILEACIELCCVMGLHFAGVDLRLTPEGAWYCFEVNPSPGFTFYDEASGGGMADALAEMLIAAASRSDQLDGDTK